MARVEKNLISLGFFTPSSKRIKEAKVKKVAFTRLIDGRKVVSEVSIVPGAVYGLPITADQDKYLALQKIITDLHKRDGEVRNPIGFSSAELLRLLRQHQRSGRNYDRISEWLNVMTTTTIISEGVVYLAGRKAWVSDRFHVFDRAVSFGSEMDDGKRADRNYVWLSEWQLDNINSNHVVPIDFDAYRRLRNHVAKALLPLLQIWLYASRDAGRFEKRYDELCQVLNLRYYPHRSKIKEKLGSSFDELVTCGYLSGWSLRRTSDGKGHKLIMTHGKRFLRDQGQQLTKNPPISRGSSKKSDPRHEATVDRALLEELVRRGVPENQALKLLSNLVPGQDVMDQLEWGDYSIRQNRGSKITNPTGFYIHLVKENAQPSEGFESSRIKRLREERRQASERQQQERVALELAYHNYRSRVIEAHIATHYSESEYQDLLERKRRELEPRYRRIASWKPETLEQFLRSAVRDDIEKELTFLTFEAFCEKQFQQSKPSSFANSNSVDNLELAGPRHEARVPIASCSAASVF